MEKVKKIKLSCEQDTVNLGKKLAKIAKTKDVFALYGTLGMGKSVLARSFIQTLTGVKDVPSPTFTLMQLYEAADFDIYHFDLYRLKSPEEIYEIGVEEAIYTGVSLIEWPEKMSSLLPSDIFKITIEQEGDGRSATIQVSSEEKITRLNGINL